MEYLPINYSWIFVLGVLTLSLIACQDPADKASDAKTSSIDILEVIEIDSVVADFPVGFAFINSGEWQFIGYYNKDRYLTVASRKISQQRWNYKVLPLKVGWDSHNRITMALDRDHCLHLSGNMHNDSLVYFKTERPFDIASFKKVFPVATS